MTPSARPARHKAWMLYQLYCVVAFLLHIVLAWGLWRVIQDPYPVGLTLSPNDIEIAQYAAETLRKGCIVLLCTSLFFGVGSLAILRFRDTKEAWITHLINLALGALTCVLLPLAVPVGMMMMREDFKEWFIRAPTAPPAP